MSAVDLLVDSALVRSPGGEKLQVELVSALDRTCPEGSRGVVLRRRDQDVLTGFSVIRDQCIDRPVGNHLQKVLWLRQGQIRWARRTGARALFAANGLFSPRLLKDCGVVTTTNNMVPFSTAHQRAGSVTAKLHSWVQKWMVTRSLTIADAVVLHSRHALDMVSKFTGDISGKTTVVLTGIPHGYSASTALARTPHPNRGRPYLLYFSAIRWYKNHLGLIEAYRRLARRINDLPELILAGLCKDPGYLADIESAIAAGSLQGRVRYVGEIPEGNLPVWLHHATVNVFPSLVETNSIIQAEILGVHGVMATSGRPPMSEVASDAAEFFDPEDPDDIARTLESLWRDPDLRDQLRQRAKSRALQLSWDACGMAIWQAAHRASKLHQQRIA